MITLLIAAAAILLLWPKGKPGGIEEVMPSPFDGTFQQKNRPSYQNALVSLAAVRMRLIHTDTLDDEAKASIDTLTLALVKGSDQE